VSPPKLVLAVIDALKPSMLERAIDSGRAPALQAVMERGVYVRDCVSAFPSVTPTCAASIATGTTPDRHRIPSMNWYHRGEHRYVEYGSSFQASRTFGILRSLTDTVYNMNLAHLSKEVETVFETLDDRDVRTAGTTYLIYRGRHRHEVSGERALARIATATAFRHAVWGPRELFYADLFASQRTGCFSQLGLPGLRDQHAGCVGAHLVREDLFDFLLLSLPDNDTRSHKLGPHAQVQSIHEADRQLERLFHAAGGADAFLADHAVIVMGDHSQSPIEERIGLAAALHEDHEVLQPTSRDAEAAELAVCPASRAAMIYVLDPDSRDAMVRPLAERSLELDGVELAAWCQDGEAVVRGEAGELRFAPGGDLEDLRGERWSVEGKAAVLDLEIHNGGVWSETYPDALARLWASLANPTAGDVQLSAAPGFEFTDWGGADHVGGGAHGSLHRNDSHGALLWCGTGPEDRSARRQWTIRDAAALTLGHFGVPDEEIASVSSGA
jgi:predicted AlkP superfamily pyrophosphatase or phosphodiesterase